MEKEVMFSSKSGDWATPQDFFDKLNGEFRFTLDPCMVVIFRGIGGDKGG